MRTFGPTAELGTGTAVEVVTMYRHETATCTGLYVVSSVATKNEDENLVVSALIFREPGCLACMRRPC